MACSRSNIPTNVSIAINLKKIGSDPTTWPIGAQAWQGELVWRDFYRQLMWNNPRVSKNKPLKTMDFKNFMEK